MHHLPYQIGLGVRQSNSVHIDVIFRQILYIEYSLVIYFYFICIKLIISIVT